MAAHASLYSTDQISDSNNRLLKGVAVNVYLKGTTTPTPLYLDRNKTPGVNPVLTDAALGNLAFYADPGLYDLVAQIGSVIGPPETVQVPPCELDLPGSAKQVLGVFSQNPLLVAAGTNRLVASGAFTLTGAVAAIDVAPGVTPIIVDVLKNGVSVYTTVANRPTIPVAGFASQVEIAPDVATFAFPDYLTISVLQAGSVAQGKLTVAVSGNRVA
jgi:hypothetical protein